MTAALAQLVRDTASGEGARRTRAAAKLMTLLENQPGRLPELLTGSADWPQPRLVLGVTGAPGSGKSTLTDALVAEHRRRYPDQRVGVIAVDPSSPFTGGAVLGDRVRMMRHATDPLVFVRSMASRGHLGGLTLGVRGVLRVLGLLGCATVLVETVGVGQSEVEVVHVADLVLIVLAPGQGDSIQLLKAGLMEIGDLYAVNKADKPGAAELHAALLSSLKLGVLEQTCGPHHQVGVESTKSEGQSAAEQMLPHAEAPVAVTPGGMVAAAPGGPEVYLVSSLEHTGIELLLDGLAERQARQGPEWLARRKAAVTEEVAQAVLDEARNRVAQTMGSNGTVTEQVQRVLRGEVSVPDLAQELLKRTCERK